MLILDYGGNGPSLRGEQTPIPRSSLISALQAGAESRRANNKLVLILTRHTLARAGLANRLLDRHEVVTIDGDVVTLRQATP